MASNTSIYLSCVGRSSNTSIYLSDAPRSQANPSKPSKHLQTPCGMTAKHNDYSNAYSTMIETLVVAQSMSAAAVRYIPSGSRKDHY